MQIYSRAKDTFWSCQDVMFQAPHLNSLYLLQYHLRMIFPPFHIAINDQEENYDPWQFLIT